MTQSKYVKCPRGFERIWISQQEFELISALMRKLDKTTFTTFCVPFYFDRFVEERICVLMTKAMFWIVRQMISSVNESMLFVLLHHILYYSETLIL